MRRGFQAFLALSVAGFAASAHASWESMAHVAQPLMVEAGETAIWVSQIPYIGHDLHPRDRGKALRMTTQPNHVRCDRRIENRNLAARAGIAFTVETVPDVYGGAAVTAMKDTLRVTVTFGTPEESLNPKFDDILQATLWCGLLNARQAWPAVKFIEYSIEKPELRAWSGIYSLEGVASSAAPRWGEQDKAKLQDLRRQ